jgi:hypothetical protein
MISSSGSPFSAPSVPYSMVIPLACICGMALLPCFPAP